MPLNNSSFLLKLRELGPIRVKDEKMLIFFIVAFLYKLFGRLCNSFGHLNEIEKERIRENLEHNSRALL